MKVPKNLINQRILGLLKCQKINKKSWVSYREEWIQICICEYNVYQVSRPDVQYMCNILLKAKKQIENSKQKIENAVFTGQKKNTRSPGFPVLVGRQWMCRYYTGKVYSDRDKSILERCNWLIISKP